MGVGKSCFLRRQMKSEYKPEDTFATVEDNYPLSIFIDGVSRSCQIKDVGGDKSMYKDLYSTWFEKN